jgi:hypothetical protein
MIGKLSMHTHHFNQYNVLFELVLNSILAGTFTYEQ